MCCSQPGGCEDAWRHESILPGVEQWTNKIVCVCLCVCQRASVAVLHCFCPHWSSQELFVPRRRSHVTIFEQLDVMFACLLCSEIWADKADCENSQSAAEKHPKNVGGHAFPCYNLLLLVVHFKPVSHINLKTHKLWTHLHCVIINCYHQWLMVEQNDWQATFQLLYCLECWCCSNKITNMTDEKRW